MLKCQELTIRVRDLKIPTIIGVYDQERVTEQVLIWNLELKIRENAIFMSDHLCDTVDYGAVARRLSAFVKAQKSHLLEHLAQLAVREVFEVDERIYKVCLEIFKPGCIADAEGAVIRMSFSKE